VLYPGDTRRNPSAAKTGQGQNLVGMPGKTRMLLSLHSIAVRDKKRFREHRKSRRAFGPKAAPFSAQPYLQKAPGPLFATGNQSS